LPCIELGVRRVQREHRAREMLVAKEHGRTAADSIRRCVAQEGLDLRPAPGYPTIPDDRREIRPPIGNPGIDLDITVIVVCRQPLPRERRPA